MIASWPITVKTRNNYNKPGSFRLYETFQQLIAYIYARFFCKGLDPKCKENWCFIGRCSRHYEYQLFKIL